MSMEDERELVWDWLKHEDTLMFTRNNYFLVATAILFSAFVAVSTSNNSDNVVDGLPQFLAYAGVILCFVWEITIFVQVQYTSLPLQKEFVESRAFKAYSRIHEMRQKKQFFAGVVGASLPIFWQAMFLLTLYKFVDT